MAKTKIVEEKKKKVMAAITDSTIRGIINRANKLQIQKESYVSLMKDNGQFILIYYIEMP